MYCCGFLYVYLLWVSHFLQSFSEERTTEKIEIGKHTINYLFPHEFYKQYLAIKTKVFTPFNNYHIIILLHGTQDNDI